MEAAAVVRAACSADEARALTDRIRGAAESLWALLAEAHDRKAWAALGYETFKAYVETEFGMSQRRAYQLLDQARVVQAICAAANVDGTDVQLSEAEARDLKPHLDLVAQNVLDATVDTPPEARAAAARAAVEETRRHLREQREADVERDEDDGILEGDHEDYVCPECSTVWDDINGDLCPSCGHDDPQLINEPQSEPEPTSGAIVRPGITKPDLGDGISHPARFSSELIPPPYFAELLAGFSRVLDPFAGTGRIHQLQMYGHVTVGVEIEPEWAALHEETIVGDALDLPFDDGEFDGICTSPTYGNRLADHHNASDPETRRSYTHDLGRALHPNNSGSLHWGDAYRSFHDKAWCEAVRVLRPGGRFVLNISDHIRAGKWQDVGAWHAETLMALGLRFVTVRPVVTRRLRQGDTAGLRVPAELVWVFDKERL